MRVYRPGAAWPTDLDAADFRVTGPLEDAEVTMIKTLPILATLHDGADPNDAGDFRDALDEVRAFSTALTAHDLDEDSWTMHAVYDDDAFIVSAVRSDAGDERPFWTIFIDRSDEDLMLVLLAPAATRSTLLSGFLLAYTFAIPAAIGGHVDGPIPPAAEVVAQVQERAAFYLPQLAEILS